MKLADKREDTALKDIAQKVESDIPVSEDDAKIMADEVLRKLGYR